MNIILVSVLALLLQGSVAPVQVSMFAGRWVIAPTVGRAQGSRMFPSFVVAVKDGKTLVTLEGARTPFEAFAYTPQGSTDVTALMVNRQIAPGRKQVILIRSLGPSDVKCEMFMEFEGPVPGTVGNRNHFTASYRKA